MAVVRGPLMSLGAQGRLGHQIYFSKAPAGARASELVTPSGSPSLAQEAHRALVAAGMAAWVARAFTSLDTAQWAAMLRRSPSTWSTYNAFLSNFLGYPDNGEPWTQPRFTGYENLSTSSMAVYVATGGISTAPTLQFGYTPRLELGANVGFPAPWHGGDWSCNFGGVRPHSLIWLRLVLSASSNRRGASPLFTYQLP